MIVLVGASASGKTELAKKLYQTYGYSKCVTTTTRRPRQNEIDGRDYHFINPEHFQMLIDQDAFYEVTHYNQNIYGIQKKDVNVNGVVIVDPSGANTLVTKASKDVFVVYLETNKETRKKRMQLRGDTKDAIDKRLETDDHIFDRKEFLRIDLWLKNEHHSITELAKTVHESYQQFMINKQ